MTDLQEMNSIKEQLASATRQADELAGMLKDAEAKLKERDLQIAVLRDSLQSERDCVLRQQRELNRLKAAGTVLSL